MKNFRYRNVKRGIFDSPVGKNLSWLLLLESIMMLIPMVVSLSYGEGDWKGFLVGAISSGVIGGAGAVLFRRSDGKLTRRDAYLLITLVWILFSGFSMIPFLMCEHSLGVASAYFESISGFTTTGATTIDNVAIQSKGVLLWRAMTQWIGGLGIVLFLIALLPTLNDDGGIMMFNAEITGITHDKLHPRIRQTAMSLWLVYLVLTLALILLLMIGGMSPFDSICQSMATMSTGGFSTRNGSISAWHSGYIASVIAIFMTLGGVNFILLYNAARMKWRDLLQNDVLRMYLIIVACVTAILSIDILCKGLGHGVDGALVSPFFHVASAITSTGFSYADFGSWGSVCIFLTILLMICGACAGSTTGALKVDRVLAILKNMRRQIVLTVYPRHISVFDVGGHEVDDSSMMRVGGFLGLYIALLLIGTLAMTAYGYGFTESLFSSASCVGNNGLGLGATGGSYDGLPDLVKWVFSAEMLIGRLEIYTVVALLLPSFWRRA